MRHSALALDRFDILRTPLHGPSVWDRASVRRNRSWLHQLRPGDLAEIDRMLERIAKRGLNLETVTRADFTFAGFGTFLRRFLWRDVAGRGFGVIRGLPRERYSDEELGVLFWAIGSHLGTGVSQNAQGDRLGHVRSRELDYDALDVRGYQTSHALAFHCDPSDVVGLLSLRKARSGGLSSIVSGHAVYNAILRERPDLLPLLYRGFAYDRRGEEAFYQKPVSDPVPVFAHVDGEMSMRYVRKSIETGRAKLGQPFSAEEEDALAYVDSVTERESLVCSMMLEEGDMQFVNNYLVLHSRTGFEDHALPEQRRHLLRLWLKVPGFRQLDPRFIEWDEASGWSRREGIRPPDAPMPGGARSAANV